MIDVNFDFQAEAGGNDSDKYSPTLQEYHRILWSKPLPNGELFLLKKISDNRLYHKSELGEFFLSSDRAIATFTTWKKAEPITSLVPKAELEKFVRLSDTIGGIVIWPSRQIDGLPTINALRGFNRQIADRLDLTLECIRRYYRDEDSPLYETIKRYESFFARFRIFQGYIDFFLLQDAVASDYCSVKIAPTFDNFQSAGVPKSAAEYKEYMKMTSQFMQARNERIAADSNVEVSVHRHHIPQKP